MDFQDIVLDWADDLGISLQNEWIDLQQGGEWSVDGNVSRYEYSELIEDLDSYGYRFKRVSQDVFAVYVN